MKNGCRYNKQRAHENTIQFDDFEKKYVGRHIVDMGDVNMDTKLNRSIVLAFRDGRTDGRTDGHSITSWAYNYGYWILNFNIKDIIAFFSHELCISIFSSLKKGSSGIFVFQVKFNFFF